MVFIKYALPFQKSISPAEEDHQLFLKDAESHIEIAVQPDFSQLSK